MRKVLLCSIGVLAITVINYLAVAFISLEINALNWASSHRMGFIYMSVVWSWIGVGLPAILYRKPQRPSES